MKPWIQSSVRFVAGAVAGMSLGTLDGSVKETVFCQGSCGTKFSAYPRASHDSSSAVPESRSMHALSGELRGTGAPSRSTSDLVNWRTLV